MSEFFILPGERDTARFIGLTATPSAETLEFFDKNLAVNYTYEKKVPRIRGTFEG